MGRYALIALMGFVLSACASQADRGASVVNKTTRVKLQSGEVPSAGAKYDGKAGTCSSGSTQLVTREQFEALSAEWSVPKSCKGATKKQVPGSTGYPARFAQLQKPGSAQVLVRVRSDGTVESAHAVCATDSAFADAAVETAKAIAYSAGSCDNGMINSAILLPFDYGWK